MDVFKGKVVGIGRGNGKNSGKPFTMLHVSGKPFSEQQLKNGSCGNQVSTYFVDANIVSKVNDQLVGKEVTISSVFAGGRDVLCDITV